MIRRTIKLDNGLFAEDAERSVAVVDCLQKLGIIEDVEEYVGCPLDVLFKALKDGVYEDCLGTGIMIKRKPVYIKIIQDEVFLICEPLYYLSARGFKKDWWLDKDKTKVVRW